MCILRALLSHNHWIQFVQGDCCVHWPCKETMSYAALCAAAAITRAYSHCLSWWLVPAFKLCSAMFMVCLTCCTGRHASVLNVIVAHLPPEHPAFETVQLQETLGHTPFEVVMGAAVGLVIGAVVTGLWGLVAG